MKKVFLTGAVPFLSILILSSIWVGGVSALELSQAWELKLTADDLPPAADFGRSVAIDGNLVAVGAGGG